MNYTKLRKTLGLSISGLLLTMAVAAVLAPRSYAVNLQDAQTAAFDQTANAGSILGGANTSKAVNLAFTGRSKTGALATSTGAYVTISATAMTVYQPFGTVDASVGTAGVITFSSTLQSNTMGALCDYLNGLGASYKCALLSAKRDDPPGVVLKTQTSTNGTGNLAAVGGLSVLNTTSTYVSLGITPAAGRRVVLEQCAVNGQSSATDNFLYIYGQLRKCAVLASPFAVDALGVACDDTYLVWQSSTVQNTTSTMPSGATAGLAPWVEFAQGAHVVIRAGLSAGGSGAVQTAANFVACVWSEK